MKEKKSNTSSITAIKLHDNDRDKYIYSKYSTLSPKSEAVKNALAIGLKIEETMPFLHKLILLCIEQNKDLTIKDIEDVFLIDKKYSIMIDDNNVKSTSNKKQTEPHSSNNKSDLVVEKPLLSSDISTPKSTMKIPDLLKNISK